MLEHEIERWRSAWRPHLGPERADVLDELEGHLREGVRDALARGEQPAEALARAIAGLGTPEAFARELAKVPAEVLPWWPARFVDCSLAAAVVVAAALAAPRLAQGGLAGLLALHVGLVSIGYLAATGLGVLAALFLGCRLLRDPLPAHKRSLRRSSTRLAACAAVATLAGVALGLFCPFEKTGPVLGLSPHEVGGLAILAGSAAAWVGFRRARPSSNLERRMLYGLAAGAAVVLGWPGARLIGAQPGGADVALVLGLCAAHLALAASAFARPNCLQRSPSTERTRS